MKQEKADQGPGGQLRCYYFPNSLVKIPFFQRFAQFAWEQEYQDRALRIVSYQGFRPYHYAQQYHTVSVLLLHPQ